jgi:hypothetical protein
VSFILTETSRRSPLHPNSYLVDTGALIYGLDLPGRKFCHYLPSNAKLERSYRSNIAIFLHGLQRFDLAYTLYKSGSLFSVIFSLIVNYTNSD